MDVRIPSLPFPAIVAIQVLTFLYMILTLSNNFVSPLFFIIFFGIEVALYLPVIYKMSNRWFYLGWQFQFFLLLLLLVLFRFEVTFKITDVASETRLFFIGALFFAESILFAALLLREKSVKPILLVLASSTTIAVFLIVGFVMSEAMPAFGETGPIDMITGTRWSPYYNIDVSESANITTRVEPYNFTLATPPGIVYGSPGQQRDIPVTVINTGGIRDSFTLAISAPDELTATINNSTLPIPANDRRVATVTVSTAATGTYMLTVDVTSAATGQYDRATITYQTSSTAVELSPRRQSLLGVGVQAGLMTTPLILQNLGTTDDTYTLSIEHSPRFNPSIAGENITWDYDNATGVIEASAGQQLNLTIRPRLITRIEGTYIFNITAASQRNSAISTTALLEYTYKQRDLLSVNVTEKATRSGEPVTYNFTVIGRETQKRDLRISGIDDGWTVILTRDNQTLLSGEGLVPVNLSKDGTAHLSLHITPGSSVTQDMQFTIITGKEGTEPSVGILPFIVGTISTTAIAVAIAAPLGIGIAVFLAEFCPSRLRRFLRPIYELLAGIPSVVYGLWGFLTFAPWLADNIYPHIVGSLGQHIALFSESSSMGHSILTASIVLSIMILPIVLTLSEDAIRSVKKSLKNGSLAMGATRWQTMRRVILPEAKSGIVSSIILGTGRAIGETMAVLMIMQFSSTMPTSLFDNVGTMTSTIAAVMPSAFSQPATRQALFAIGFILFLMIFALNIIVALVQRSSSRKKSASDGIATMWDTLRSLFTRQQPSSDRPADTFILVDDEPSGEDVDTAGTFQQMYTTDSAEQRDTTKKTVSFRQMSYGIRTHAQRNQTIIVALFIAGAVFVSGFLFFLLEDVIVTGIQDIKLTYFIEEEIGIGIKGGFANAITGSLQLVAIAIAVAAPLSIGAAIYVQEYAKQDNIFTRIIMFTSDTLASTPSIVYGAFGFIFFVLYLGFDQSLLAGGLTLALMAIPLMLRSSIEAIKSVPYDYQEGSLALGATKWQTIKNVVLPAAAPGITSGAIISIGRVIGETAAIIFTAGYAQHIATSIMQPAGSLPSLIFKNYHQSLKFPELHAKIYSVALILLLIVLVLNTIARLVSYRSAKMLGEEWE